MFKARPDLGLSGSFQVEKKTFLEDVLQAHQGRRKPIRFYLDSGTIDFTRDDDGRKDTAAVVAELRKVTATDSPALEDLWRTVAGGERTTAEALRPTPAEQFLILIECRDDKHQVELLGKLQADGIPCKALIS